MNETPTSSMLAAVAAVGAAIRPDAPGRLTKAGKAPTDPKAALKSCVDLMAQVSALSTDEAVGTLDAGAKTDLMTAANSLTQVRDVLARLVGLAATRPAGTASSVAADVTDPTQR